MIISKVLISGCFSTKLLDISLPKNGEGAESTKPEMPVGSKPWNLGTDDGIDWVLPPPCNSRKGFTFWFNRGFLLPSFWDCYRLGAVPKVKILAQIVE